MTVLLHLTEASNVASIQAEGFKAAIGPRSSMINEPSPAVYFFRTLSDVDTAVSSWLGDAFDEDAKIALLAVDLYVDVEEDPTQYEVSIASDIAPAGIVVLTDDIDQVTDLESFQAQIESMGRCLSPKPEDSNEGLSL